MRYYNGFMVEESSLMFFGLCSNQMSFFGSITLATNRNFFLSPSSSSAWAALFLVSYETVHLINKLSASHCERMGFFWVMVWDFFFFSCFFSLTTCIPEIFCMKQKIYFWFSHYLHLSFHTRWLHVPEDSCSLLSPHGFPGIIFLHFFHFTYAL